MLAEHALAPCVHLRLGERRKALFFWDLRCPQFANKYETPKITLKEWRARSAIVLSTRCHLKLMRAVSSPDNEARRGFCVPKGAGDTQGSFPTPVLAAKAPSRDRLALGRVWKSQTHWLHQTQPLLLQLEKCKSFPARPNTLSCRMCCIGALLPLWKVKIMDS